MSDNPIFKIACPLLNYFQREQHGDSSPQVEAFIYFEQGRGNNPNNASYNPTHIMCPHYREGRGCHVKEISDTFRRSENDLDCTYFQWQELAEAERLEAIVEKENEEEEIGDDDPKCQ